MLELFGSGLLSLWLDMVGLHVKPLAGLELLELQGGPELVLFPDANPTTTLTLAQYLKELQAKKLVGAYQGIWMQSGPMLLANHQGTVPLSAASLTKIATSLAALKAWGPNHQFETLISATGPVNNGVLQGNLVVQGSGDPLFVTEEAIAVARSLNQIGIKRVAGNLIISGNFAMNYQYNPTLAGEMLKQILNSQLWHKAAVVRPWSPQDVPQPQVEIAGTVQVTALALPFPRQIVLVRHRSLPLTQIIKQMNIYSNNDMAEILAIALGGAQVVRSSAATTAMVPQSEIQMINGSGLGMENRISPRAVCAMLIAIQRELQPYHLTVSDLFLVAGHDRHGTIYGRHIPVNTVVKTGTLNEVSALAGVMPTKERGLVWFCIINRGKDVLGFRNSQDQFLQKVLHQLGSAPILPVALTSHSLNTMPLYLGAASRNEILYEPTKVLSP